mgnify:CR=1 FL=1
MDEIDELRERFFADRLIAGIDTWEDVPEKYRKGVTEELAIKVVLGELEELKMLEIINALKRWK